MAEAHKVYASLEECAARVRYVEQERDDVGDAALILVAVYDERLADDLDTEFDHLFERGLLRQHRDIADEYVTTTTPEGDAFLRRVLGAKWRCGDCRCLNRPDESSCYRCGAGRDDG